jgi:hypothetical protein
MNGPSDRTSFLAGMVAGLTGLAMLVRVDVPTIRAGGIGAALSVLELLAAVTMLSGGVAVWRYESRRYGR